MIFSPRQVPLLLLAALSIAACEGGGASPSAHAGAHSDASESTATRPPVGPSAEELQIDRDRVTTSGALAAKNLNSQIDALAEQFERTGLASMGQRLVELLSLRASMLGAYDDLSRIDGLTADALDMGDPITVQQRAAYLRAVHRFDAAEALIEGAERGGLSAELFVRDRLTVELAIGGDPEALVLQAEAALGSDPSYAAQVLLAGSLAAAGRFEAADAMFRAALADYRDSAPFIVAWNAFQRGVMWGEAAGRPDLAMPLYREAVRRLPGYVVANVHLAELEAEAAQSDAAEARLRRLVEAEVQDPEPYGLLAELRAAEGEAGDSRARAEAERLGQTARARYDVLLARHPEAFADHGSEFFAGIGGDPERGLSLSLFNLARRANPRAYVVAIEAASAAGEPSIRCRVSAEAAPWDARHPVLSELRASLDCPSQGAVETTASGGDLSGDLGLSMGYLSDLTTRP